MEYYDKKCLKIMGNRIGKTLKIDFTIEEMMRGKYARVCVLVDLMKLLIPLIRVGGRDIRIEYEGIHLLYFQCKVYGHSANNCQSKTNNMDKSKVMANNLWASNSKMYEEKSV